jgi:hypothetical protein
MRVFIDYNTDDARRKQRRGVVVVEPLVFVMIVSTKALAVTVTKSFFLHTHGEGEESVEACDNEEFCPTHNIRSI